MKTGDLLKLMTAAGCALPLAVAAQVTISGGNVSVNTGGTSVRVDGGKVGVEMPQGGTSVKVDGSNVSVKAPPGGKVAIAVGSNQKAVNPDAGNVAINQSGTINGKPVPNSTITSGKPGKAGKSKPGRKEAGDDDKFWGDKGFWGEDGPPGGK
jgi:hypothetical protein